METDPQSLELKESAADSVVADNSNCMEHFMSFRGVGEGDRREGEGREGGREG